MDLVYVIYLNITIFQFFEENLAGNLAGNNHHLNNCSIVPIGKNIRPLSGNRIKPNLV
jgi:hypothetical protein